MAGAAGLIVLFLCLGVSFAAYAGAASMTRGECVQHFKSFADQIEANEETKERYWRTHNAVETYGGTANLAENITKSVWISSEAQAKSGITVAKIFWDVIREMCAAIKSGFYEFAVSSGAVASDAASIAEAGGITNFAASYEKNRDVENSAVNFCAALAQGVAALGVPIFIIYADTPSESAASGQPGLCGFKAFYPTTSRSANLQYGDRDTYNAPYMMPDMAVQSFNFAPALKTAEEMRALYPSEEYPQYTFSTSYYYWYFGQNSGALCEASVRSAYVDTKDISDWHKLDEAGTKKTQVSTSEMQVFQQYFPVYKLGLTTTQWHGVTIGKTVVQPPAPAKVKKDVYGKVLTDTAEGALGDVYTKGRVIDDSGVIAGPVSVAIPDALGDVYDRVVAGEGYYTDVATQAGVIPLDVAADKTIVDDALSEQAMAEAFSEEEDLDPGVITPPPSISSSDTGFISMWNPTKNQIAQLANIMWSADFFTNISKMISDPIDGIVSLSLVPIQPSTDGSRVVNIGNFNTGISMPHISNQYGTFSAGSIAITEKYHNFLDYSPYTKVSLYIPFIGFVELNTNEVMGASVSINYNIDFLTGESIAQVGVTGNGLKNTAYMYRGNMAMQLPVTGANYSRVYSAIIQGAMNVGAVAMGGAAGVAVAASATSAVLNTATSAGQAVERSGQISGNSGFLGNFTPYAIITRPKPRTPAFAPINGYVDNAVRTIGSVKGYVRVSEVHLSGIAATESELNEIASLLKGGVEV